MDKPILITGASGQVGAAVMRHLLAEKKPLRLLARNPNKLHKIEDAEIAQGNYSDNNSLDHAFTGVEAAFIVSGYAAPGERAKLHRNAFQAAKRAGVPYLIYLSFLGASHSSYFSMSRDHFESEQYLRETGIEHTILQDSFYAELAPEMFGQNGILKGPAGTGKVSWVGREEVAEAIAVLLTNRNRVFGTLPITGPSAMSLAETAAALSTLTGRSLRYEEQPVDEAFQSRAGLGAPDWEVATWVGSYQAIGAGEVAQVDPVLGQILGRPALDFISYFKQYPQLLPTEEKEGSQ